MKNLTMQSCVHAEGSIECALFESEVPTPGPDEVILEVEAAPINPSDLGLMFGIADTDTAAASERNGHTSVVVPLPEMLQRAMASREGRWLPGGNEGVGRVIAAGDSPAAQALMGKRVGAFNGEMFARYSKVSVMACLPLAEDVTAEQGASCFVNPMTALGFVETARMEGHEAIIHAAAASNLGQMLNRICIEDGIPLVNIVRSEEQKQLLLSQNATWVLNTQDADFRDQLLAAIEATGARLAFDPIGGGTLSNQILAAMETAAQRRMPAWSRYGSDEFKQVYIYGMLDPSPTTLTRGYGFSWSISGWLLTPFLQKFGMERVVAMRERVAASITTTFASYYSDRVKFEDMLGVEAVKRYGKKATGQKTLVLMAD